MVEYSFRPMTPDDLPMFRHWVDQPHMAGWWGDSATEARLAEEDMGRGVVDMQIAQADGTPFAFIQDYNAHAFDAPQYADQPADARAIDMLLGDPAYLRQGHGSGFVAARTRQLRQVYSCILTDPDPANTRAITAYTRAGFRPVKVTPCEDGDLVQVMSYV